MNVVHAVLRNGDILHVIINFVKDDSYWGSGRGDSDLVAVALVCREFSDPALTVLWRDIQMEDIYSLFPKDIIRVNSRGKKSLVRIPAIPKQWERFNVYASRIRKLSASPLRKDRFLHGIRTRYPTPHHPFPNLTWLRWSSVPSRIVDATILVCPTLVKVQLDIEEPGANEQDDDNAVAEVLRSLGETCSYLKKFEYEHYSIPHNQSKSVESALLYLIRQCRRLEEVHLPVSRALLRSLAGLPHLSTLGLDHVKWEDGSRSYIPMQADEWIEEMDRFPVLDDLTIQYSHSVSLLQECFQDSGCFPRKSFTMMEFSKHVQWPTLTIAEFFCGLMRPDRSEGLHVFRIDRQTDYEIPVVHDPWQALRFLSSIPTLQTLTLNDLFLDINDADLEEIPRIWPKLQSLTLEFPCHSEDYQSQISFQGLAHLSSLENLETVSLMLAPESTISESMLSPSTGSNSRLKHLNIQGNFPPVPAYKTALFLIIYFPKLERISNLNNFDRREEERLKKIQVIWHLVRLTMHGNLRSELLNCKSRSGVEQEGRAD